jgi:hypothetical protein
MDTFPGWDSPSGRMRSCAWRGGGFLSGRYPCPVKGLGRWKLPHPSFARMGHPRMLHSSHCGTRGIYSPAEFIPCSIKPSTFGGINQMEQFTIAVLRSSLRVVSAFRARISIERHPTKSTGSTWNINLSSCSSSNHQTRDRDRSKRSKKRSLGTTRNLETTSFGARKHRIRQRKVHIAPAPGSDQRERLPQLAPQAPPPGGQVPDILKSASSASPGHYRQGPSERLDRDPRCADP